MVTSLFPVLAPQRARSPQNGLIPERFLSQYQQSSWLGGMVMQHLKARHGRTVNRANPVKSWSVPALREVKNTEDEWTSTIQSITGYCIYPKHGLDAHAHEDVEIITYVLSGTLAYKDNIGNATLLQAGSLHWLNAGSGALHSEFNPSDTETVQYLQWIISTGASQHAPITQQANLFPCQQSGQWYEHSGPTLPQSSITAHAAYIAQLTPDETLDFPACQTEPVWIQMLSGAVEVNGTLLQAEDALMLAKEKSSLTGVSRLAKILIIAPGGLTSQ